MLDLILDQDGRTPLYTQIEDAITRLVEDSKLQEGDRLPGEAELAEALRVSVTTTRKAYSVLHKRGIIKRVRKAGTFVARPKAVLTPTVGFFYDAGERRERSEESHAIHTCLAQQGYDLKIFPYERGYFGSVDLYEEVRRKGLCAAIIEIEEDESCKDGILRLEQEQFPYIRLHNPFFYGRFRGTLIEGNEVLSLRDAIRHLEGFGHTRMGFIPYTKAGDDCELYHRLFSRKPEFRAEWFFPVEYHEPLNSWSQLPALNEVTKSYLVNNPEITGVVVSHPAVCLDLLRQAEQMQKRVPEDLSIICLHDCDGFLTPTPPITAMSLPSNRLAEACVAQLIRTIRNGIPKHDKVVRIGFNLIERASVCSPKD